MIDIRSRNSTMFWNYFEKEAAPHLGLREVSFRKVFQYLDSFDSREPILIVETGCIRTAGNWIGDGQSTLMFDRYLQDRTGGGRCFAIDIDPEATTECRAMVSEATTLFTGDSVSVLRDLSSSLSLSSPPIALLYLDSFDLDWENPTPSAVHHLKELVSIYQWLTPTTLVVVDDSPTIVVGATSMTGDFQPVRKARVGGKGQYVAEYASQVGAQLLFSHYQAG